MEGDGDIHGGIVQINDARMIPSSAIYLRTCPIFP
jgi:hypothetical protein